jgi:hypothetical protein
MKLINMTPHPVRLYKAGTPDRVENPDDGVVMTLEPSGQLARLGESVLGEETILTDEVDIPVSLVSYAEVEGLPEPQQGVAYVVPLMTALAAGRDDLLVPYEQVRNGEGTVVGCRRLGRVQTR